MKCGFDNPRRRLYCIACGKLRPSSVGQKPAHRTALTASYDEFAALNGSETCGICGAVGKTRRLHRDHDHRQGVPRGLLCFRCNAALRPYMTGEWCRRAAHYLDRAANRAAEERRTA